MSDLDQRRRRAVPAALRLTGRAIRVVVGAPARAVRGTARRVADPARQVADYWASERVTMRQGFLAVSIAAVTSLVAGLTLAAMRGRIEVIEGLFILIPASIGMRGSIFGALAARLGTSIHSGLFEVSSDRRGVLFQNIYAAALLTIGTSVTVGLVARAMAGLLGIETVSVWALIAVALVGGLLSSVIVLGLTVWLSIVSFRRGWDLDAVGAPLITAIGDVVTLPFLLLASYLVDSGAVILAVGVLGLTTGAAALARGWTTALPLARRIMRESFPILSIAIGLTVLAGIVVDPRVEEVFVPLPALLIVIPSFLENTGALGSILAARLGSKLHLGAVTPRARPDAAALLDGTIVIVLGITVYAISALLALFLATVLNFGHPGAVRFIAIVMTGGLLATLIASLIGYYAATIAYRFGLDPDNHTIPLVTSGMDLLGVVCLILALGVFGVA